MVEVVKYKIWVGMLLRWRNTDTIDIVRVSRINSKVVYLYNYKKECEEHVYLEFLYHNFVPHWLQEKDIIEFAHKETKIKPKGGYTPNRYEVECVFIEHISMTYYYKTRSLLTNMHHWVSEIKIVNMVEIVSTEPQMSKSSIVVC